MKKSLRIPLVKRIRKQAQPKYVPRNHVIAYIAPGSIVLPKPIIDAVKRSFKKTMTNLKVNQKPHKNNHQSTQGQMIHLHKGEVVLPPKYGKILTRVMNTTIDYSDKNNM